MTSTVSLILFIVASRDRRQCSNFQILLLAIPGNVENIRYRYSPSEMFESIAVYTYLYACLNHLDLIIKHG